MTSSSSGSPTSSKKSEVCIGKGGCIRGVLCLLEGGKGYKIGEQAVARTVHFCLNLRTCRRPFAWEVEDGAKPRPYGLHARQKCHHVTCGMSHMAHGPSSGTVSCRPRHTLAPIGVWRREHIFHAVLLCHGFTFLHTDWICEPELVQNIWPSSSNPDRPT